ncbi:hypothetical protein [Nonomuraea bangladeshensis]|uniref:hypothetical protein n=1 Tax=Nonomuraea bangladeshensis TaxID=404385 RepID=UPI003C2BDD97
MMTLVLGIATTLEPLEAGSMAALISELLDDDPIRGFAGVVDTAAEESPDTYAIEPGGWATAQDNWIAIDEPIEQGCIIKYQVWDGEPPTHPPAASTWQGTVYLESGTIQPEDNAGTDLTGSRFGLGRPDRRWNVRVHRDRLGHGAFPPDVVQRTLITLQFWP